MEVIGKITIVLVTVVLGTIISGFVFNQMYSWFIIPAFNMPKITLAQAVGVMSFITFIKYRSKNGFNKKESSTKILLLAFSETICLAAVTLSFGWIITLFLN